MRLNFSGWRMGIAVPMMAAILSTFGICLKTWASSGDVDTGFNVVTTNPVPFTALQPDGKILASWRFTNGYATFVRVDSGGNLDPGFRPTLDGGAVSAVAVLPGKKIAVGGTFLTIDAIEHRNLGRLNEDGTVDQGFNTPFADTESDFRFTPLTNSQLLVFGNQYTVNGTPLARLTSSGSPDSSLSADMNYAVGSCTALTDGKTIVGGVFTHVGGLSRPGLARINPNGSLDPAFDALVKRSGTVGQVELVLLQADEKILVAGSFDSIGGGTRTNLARLNSDGTLDTGFASGLSGTVYSMALQTDGKILVGGAFTPPGGSIPTNLARLNPNGSVDVTFRADIRRPPSDISVRVQTILLQADGKILVGGSFSTIGSVAKTNIARLYNDPAPQKLSIVGKDRVEWLRGGASPEVTFVTFDLSVNAGASWSPLGVGRRIPGGWEKTGLDLPGSGWIRGQARIASGPGNGSSSLIETVTSYLPVRVNDMTVSGNEFRLSFTNWPSVAHEVFASTNLSLPPVQWEKLGRATELSPGQYQFIDLIVPTRSQRYYQIRSQ